jgi:hypothetical protein
MTKTEYREYIASKEWRECRKIYLETDGSTCNRCSLPRWLAIIAYDQDLHVHHISYARLGCELGKDLESLCRRCHEIETFGKSNLHKPQSFKCHCGEITFNSITRECEECAIVQELIWRQNQLHDIGKQ